MTLTITHDKVSSGTVNPAVEVDGADWNADHTIEGFEISGSFDLVLTVTAATALTLPETGTVISSQSTTQTIDGNLVLSATSLNPALIVGATTTTAGQKGGINIRASDNGTGAGASYTWNHGANTVGGIGGYSAMMGGSYDGTVTFFTRGLGFRFVTTAGAGFGTGIMSLDASGNLAVTAPGTGVLTALAVNVGSAGSFVVNGGALGTPSSGTLTNTTGFPLANLSGAGTGILAALAINTGSAGAPVLFNGALGTPSSGTVTNLTGTASININGTVGATTPTTGAFTTLTASTSVALTSNLNGTTTYTANNNSSGASATAYYEASNGTNIIRFGMRGTSQTAYGALAANTAFIYGASDFTIMSDGGKIVFAAGNNAEDIRISASGGLSIGTTTDAGAGAVLANTSIKSQGATAGIGYATGAGGTVTQITSKSTAVTINTVCGQITTHNAALASGAFVRFTVNNSSLAATDVIVLNMKSGNTAEGYNYQIDSKAAGSFVISMRNVTGGSLSEAVVFDFAIVKGVSS